MADVFDRIASEFIDEKKAFLTQPLRTRRDYGESHTASMPSFNDLDSDNDGYISSDEWEDAFDMVEGDNTDFINDFDMEESPDFFDDLDSDDDGIVSRGDWVDSFDDLDDDDDGFISSSSFYSRRASRFAEDFSDVSDLVDDLRNDIEEVDELIDDLDSETHESTRFVEDFDSEIGMMGKSARFSEGAKGRREFEEWMEDQPDDFQEEWESNTEKYKDKFKKASRFADDYFMEDDFMEDDFMEDDFMEDDFIEDDFMEDDFIEDDFMEDDFMEDDF